MKTANSVPSWYLWVSIGSILLSFLFAYYYNRAKKVLDLLWSVDTYESKELSRMVKGGFNATVEVEGEVSCPNPVFGPATGRACCWVNTTVEREMRRTRNVTKTDSKGNRYTETEVYYEWLPVYNETLSTLFRVKDETGYTLVDPRGSDMETHIIRQSTVQNREVWFDHVPKYSNTNCYRIQETAFLPEGYSFVLGEAVEHPDGALIRKPERGYLDPKAKFFLVYRRNEEQITRAARKGRSLNMFFGLLFFVAGIGFLIAYFGAY